MCKIHSSYPVPHERLYIRLSLLTIAVGFHWRWQPGQVFTSAVFPSFVGAPKVAAGWPGSDST